MLKSRNKKKFRQELFCYSFRWNIEVSYYEQQKAFWSLCSYMVRSRKGIETLVNLINIAYCAAEKYISMTENEINGMDAPKDYTPRKRAGNDFINKILSFFVGGNPLPLGGERSLVNGCQK